MRGWMVEDGWRRGKKLREREGWGGGERLGGERVGQTVGTDAPRVSSRGAIVM